MSVRALSGREIAGFLVDTIQLQHEEVGQLSGVHEGSVRRWRSADPDIGQPRPESELALRRTAAVVDFMLANLEIDDPERVGYFLRTPEIDPNSLEESTPLDLIANGADLKRIIESARAAFSPKAEQ